MNAPIRHVLFDFGNTLVREPFCVIAPPGVPAFEALVLATYAEGGLCDRWDAGEIGFAEVASRVAERCRLDLEATRAAMVHNWRNLRPNPRAFEFAREIGRAGRAAIVTINPDVFSQVIVPHYGLDRDFPVIVTSWQERSLDKAALSVIALDRLGAPGELATALLIDNRADNVESFKARGGQGYLFTDDSTFARDLPALRARLAFHHAPGSRAFPPATLLRDVTEGDLPVFFEQQRDPAAVRMAAFTVKDPTDGAAFAARWKRLLGDGSILKKTIVHEGHVAGGILQFEEDGKPEVAYWIGREFWGHGIATKALAEFLGHVAVRPLYARAAKDNLGSIRVLAKCGFRITGTGTWFANARGAEIEEVLLELAR